jgi:uncharacterized protein (DUF433 family)
MVNPDVLDGKPVVRGTGLANLVDLWLLAPRES